jgi:hypothetical protein
MIKYLLIGSLVLTACDELKGPIGPEGEQGATGAQGATGRTGPTGPQGEAGEAGESFGAADYVMRFDKRVDIATWSKSDQGTWIIEDGRLIVSGGITGSIMEIIANRQFDDDYVLWVDTEWISGISNNAYGLRFAQSGGKGYAFSLSASGSFIVSRWDGGTTGGGNFPIELIDWEAHPSIVRRGKNRLRVDVTGSTFTFYINSIEVASIVDSTHSGGRVGVGVSALQQVAFDNLSIAERSPLLKPIVTSQ